MPLSTRHLLNLALPLAAIVWAASPAFGGTATDTLSVQVNVQNSCSVGGTTIDFGTYSSGQQAAVDAQGNISFSGCPAGTLTISLDGGGSGNVISRRMSGGSGGSLSYQLYRNSARNQIWGTNGDALQQVLLVAGSGTIAVFGRIPGGQEVAAGGYTDVVSLTMEF
jgi:spore coat protein U-like protein